MSNLIISGIRWQIHNFKKSFLQFEKLPFNDFFPAKTIAAIIANTPHKRTSVFSPLITLQAFIFQVLSDDSSCKLAVAGVLEKSMGSDSINGVQSMNQWGQTRLIRGF